MPGEQVSVGNMAPGLELPSVDGLNVRLTDFRGQPVLISFLSHAA
jgi:peroxiredoxin